MGNILFLECAFKNKIKLLQLQIIWLTKLKIKINLGERGYNYEKD